MKRKENPKFAIEDCYYCDSHGTILTRNGKPMTCPKCNGTGTLPYGTRDRIKGKVASSSELALELLKIARHLTQAKTIAPYFVPGDDSEFAFEPGARWNTERGTYEARFKNPKTGKGGVWMMYDPYDKGKEKEWPNLTSFDQAEKEAKKHHESLYKKLASTREVKAENLWPGTADSLLKEIVISHFRSSNGRQIKDSPEGIANQIKVPSHYTIQFSFMETLFHGLKEKVDKGEITENVAVKKLLEYLKKAQNKVDRLEASFKKQMGLPAGKEVFYRGNGIWHRISFLNEKGTQMTYWDEKNHGRVLVNERSRKSVPSDIKLPKGSIL